MKTVFLDFQTFSDQTNLTAIKKESEDFVVYPLTDQNDVLKRCANTEVIITNKTQLTKELLTELPHVKLICVAATGTNNIDIAAARELGIAVTNVSGYSTPSVSQYVFSQLLRLYSRPDHHAENVTNGSWQKSPSFVYHGKGMEELAGKTMAIIGYGNLGQSVATIAQAFGMKVLIAERHDSANIRTGRVSFNEALSQADIISLHCPFTEETKGLINKETIALMKSDAVLINTSRGPVVNESDLKTALESNQLRHAILDVLDQEPPTPDYPLLQNQPQNLTITAHIAWASFEAQQRLIDLIAQNIADFKQGKKTNRVD